MFPPSVRIAPLLMIASLFGSSPASFGQSSSAARVQAIRFWSFGDVTRVAIETEGDYKLFSDQIEKPPRIYFDLTGLRPPTTAHHGSQTIEIKDRLVREIRVAEVLPGKTRVVFDLEAPADVVSSQLVNPDRLMIELRPKTQLKPTVSLARSTTGSKKIDLSASETDSTSGENSAGRPSWWLQIAHRERRM